MEFLKKQISLILLIGTLSTTHSAENVFPDLSTTSDEHLSKIIKSGVAEVCIGLTLEGISPYIPKISGQINTTQISRESFGPQTVKGMGTVLLINGTKDLFFGAKEKYSRLWTTLSDSNKGLLDLTTAASLYCLTNYMPNTLYTPYLELGGQGAAFMLISFTSVRGLKYLTTGTRDAFISTDLFQAYANAKAKAAENYLHLYSWMQKEKTT